MAGSQTPKTFALAAFLACQEHTDVTHDTIVTGSSQIGTALSQTVSSVIVMSLTIYAVV